MGAKPRDKECGSKEGEELGLITQSVNHSSNFPHFSMKNHLGSSRDRKMAAET